MWTFLELHIFMIWSSLYSYIFFLELEHMSGLPGFCRYPNNSFAIWLCTIQTWFMPIFMSRILESGFLSGSPDFQRLHLRNLHVMGSFWMQKSLQNSSGIRFCPKSIIFRHFSYFPLFIFFFGLLWSSIACSGLLSVTICLAILGNSDRH